MSLARVQTDKGGNGLEPLILIHDGSGVCMQYRRIKPLGRELWSISNPKNFTEDKWEDLSSMAGAYADKISTTIDGPCILGGWSFGGVVAFHAAQVLLENNYPVKGIVLIDSPAPLDHQPIPADIIDAVTKTSGDDSNDPGQSFSKAIRRQFTLNTKLLTSYRPAQKASYLDMILLRSKEGFDASSLPSAHVAWLEDRSNPHSIAEDWEEIVGAKVEVIGIPGNHFEPFEANNVSEVSDAIIRACEML